MSCSDGSHIGTVSHVYHYFEKLILPFICDRDGFGGWLDLPVVRVTACVPPQYESWDYPLDKLAIVCVAYVCQPPDGEKLPTQRGKAKFITNKPEMLPQPYYFIWEEHINHPKEVSYKQILAEYGDVQYFTKRTDFYY